MLRLQWGRANVANFSTNLVIDSQKRYPFCVSIDIKTKISKSPELVEGWRRKIFLIGSLGSQGVDPLWLRQAQPPLDWLPFVNPLRSCWTYLFYLDTLQIKSEHNGYTNWSYYAVWAAYVIYATIEVTQTDLFQYVAPFKHTSKFLVTVGQCHAPDFRLMPE